MTVKRRTTRKPGRKARGKAKSPRKNPPDVLQSLLPEESARLLKVLLSRNPGLKVEAREIARTILSSPTVEKVASKVHETVTSLDMGDLGGRVGKTSWGYVEPTEAAVEILSEAVEFTMVEMKRCAELGLESAAEAICRGIVTGLYLAEQSSTEYDLISYAPDFPTEQASYAIAEYIRAAPAGKRTASARRLLKVLADDVPDWHKMLASTANARRRK